MVTLHNREIYSSIPGATAPVIAAVQEILRQSMSRDAAKLLRRVERRLTQQVEEVAAEHKRLIALYSPKSDDGTALPIKSADDLTDRSAFNADYEELMVDTFEIEEIPAAALDGMTLTGTAWVSRIIVDE